MAEDASAADDAGRGAAVFVDADACPVREEAIRVGLRHGRRVFIVSNGGIRPDPRANVATVIVAEGADVADDWIAARVGQGDVVVTADVPLAARVIGAGARVVKPDGEVLGPSNIGPALAARDLMTALRSADPFRQGRGRPFEKRDRSRFLDRLDQQLRAVGPERARRE